MEMAVQKKKKQQNKPKQTKEKNRQNHWTFTNFNCVKVEQYLVGIWNVKQPKLPPPINSRKFFNKGVHEIYSCIVTIVMDCLSTGMCFC